MDVQFARTARDLLTAGGLDVNYHESDAAHHIDPAHVPAATQWLRATSDRAAPQAIITGCASLLAVAAVLLLPAAAQAAGSKVTWPEQRTYAPGETMSVKVVSTERVRAALVRESASGKVMRTVARRMLRTGTFRRRRRTPAATRCGSASVRATSPSPRPHAVRPAAAAGPSRGAAAAPMATRAELRLGATSAPRAARCRSRSSTRARAA